MDYYDEEAKAKFATQLTDASKVASILSRQWVGIITEEIGLTPKIISELFIAEFYTIAAEDIRARMS